MPNKPDKRQSINCPVTGPLWRLDTTDNSHWQHSCFSSSSSKRRKASGWWQHIIMTEFHHYSLPELHQTTLATEFSPGVRHSMKTPCCMHSHNMGRSKSPRLQTTAKFSYPDPAGHAIVCQPGSWICHCQRLHSNMLSSASATAASTSSADTSPGAASPSGAAAGIGSAPAAGSLKSDLEE